jgi:tRNA dimethylallyltransferase
LIDIVSPDEQFNAGHFVELADKAIKDIARRGKIPFVVGGTGLYIKVLCHGLAKSPGRDEAYRAGLATKGSILDLYQMLQKKDPETAARLKPNDSSRIIRALEVLYVTRRSIRDFQNKHGFRERRYDTLKIGLNIERAELYRRIEERVDRMFQDGLVAEVEGIVKRYGSAAPALKAVGYREICDAIASSPKADEAIPCNRSSSGDCHAALRLAMTNDLIKKKTRRFAKRQLTWFRADKDVKWFSPDDTKEIKKTVAEFLQIR